MVIKYLAPVFCNPFLWAGILIFIIYRVAKFCRKHVPKFEVFNQVDWGRVVIILVFIVALAVLYQVGIIFNEEFGWFGW